MFMFFKQKIGCVNDFAALTIGSGGDSMSDADDQIVVQFRQRKDRMLKGFGAAMLLIACSLGLKMISDSWPGFLGLSKLQWNALATAQFIAGMIFAIRGFRQYRCPVCSEIVRGHDKYYLGVLLNPAKCPNCGSRLS
jgi:hypothetical protein